MSNKKINAIVAVDTNWGIGLNNTMPWPNLSSDLKRFKELTTNSLILMGKNTWLSLPKKPLPNRENIIVSNSLDDPYAVKINGEPDDIIKKLSKATNKDIWIIGGENLYSQFLTYCDSVYITKIHGDFNCDRFFPSEILIKYFTPVIVESEITDNNIKIHYEIWRKNDLYN
jgi:dihydrofolate reductase